MKTNKRPELVLSLMALNGLAREIVSVHVQKALFAMGYVWSNGLWDGDVQYSKEANLHICSQDWSPRHLTWSNEMLQTQHFCHIYGAGNVAEFLEAARNGLREERVINGVKVVITPDSVVLNTSELLEKVSLAAKQIQGELWG